MSRAFMKDPEPGDPRCPGCEGLGEPVGTIIYRADDNEEIIR